MKRFLIIIASLFCLASVSSAQEKEFEGKLIDAVQKYNDDKPKEAIDILKDVDKVAPDNDAAYYYLGLSYIKLKDAENAEKNLQRAAQLDTANYWYRYRLAQLYMMTGQDELTEKTYKTLVKSFPKKTELYYDLVSLYFKENKLDDALAAISEIENLQGKSDPTVMTRFNILRQQNKAEEAYQVLRDYNKDYSSPQVLTMLGDYEMELDNDSTAIAYYDEALSLDKSYPLARLGKAEAYRVTRKYPQFFKAADDLMADDDIAPEAKANYLDGLVQHTDPRFQQTYIENLDTTISIALSHHPKDSSILQTAGIFYYRNGKPEKAIGVFKKGMDADPDNISAAANYLQVIYLTNNWERLSKESMSISERFPKEPSFIEMANAAEYNLKNYQAVIDNSAKLMALGDSASTLTALSTIGDMYHLMGESQKAYKTYDKALKLNPNYNPVLNNYAYYLSEEGKSLGKAYKMSKKTVETEPDNTTYLDTFGWILHLQKKDLEAKPFFKHAMLYGGKESKTLLLHYATVLEALGETDLAKVYRTQAEKKADDE